MDTYIQTFPGDVTLKLNLGDSSLILFESLRLSHEDTSIIMLPTVNANNQGLLVSDNPIRLKVEMPSSYIYDIEFLDDPKKSIRSFKANFEKKRYEFSYYDRVTNTIHTTDPSILISEIHKTNAYIFSIPLRHKIFT